MKSKGNNRRRELVAASVLAGIIILVIMIISFQGSFSTISNDSKIDYPLSNNSGSGAAHDNTTNGKIDPFIYQLANDRTKVYINPDKFGPDVNVTRQLDPVLMWYNKGTSASGGDWADYIFAYVRETPLNGKGDVEAIIEFWDARNVTGTRAIQIEANRQAGNVVYMVIDGNRIDIRGYTSGFYNENGTVTIYSQGQKTQFKTIPLPS